MHSAALQALAFATQQLMRAVVSLPWLRLQGFDPSKVSDKYGRHLYIWDWTTHELQQTVRRRGGAGRKSFGAAVALRLRPSPSAGRSAAEWLDGGSACSTLQAHGLLETALASASIVWLWLYSRMDAPCARSALLLHAD